jgi:hypothetical protein
VFAPLLFAANAYDFRVPPKESLLTPPVFSYTLNTNCKQLSPLYTPNGVRAFDGKPSLVSYTGTPAK